VVVPELVEESTPVAEVMGSAVLLLLQVPPAAALLNVVVPPVQKMVEPVMGAALFTVSVAVLEQPVAFA
jgi:hypothetical protein